jgi:hypothetical protein
MFLLYPKKKYMVEINEKHPIKNEQNAFTKIYWLLMAFLIVQITIYYILSINLQWVH